MERKYRQRGYQSEERPEAPKRPAARDREGPRSPAMTAFQGVMRCGMCGTMLPLEATGIELDSQCTNCRADLRTCRNCLNFDPGARWECRAAIALRVASKTARTDCEHYAPRRTLEKKTGETRSSAKPNDPRDAFERLFKK